MRPVGVPTGAWFRFPRALRLICPSSVLLQLGSSCGRGPRCGGLAFLCLDEALESAVDKGAGEILYGDGEASADDSEQRGR